MIKWSFSGLKQFINCPRQYNEVKNLKNFTVVETEQMRYGTEVHKALEDYARDRTPLPKFYAKYKSMVDVLLEIPGDKFIEHKMALSADKLPCEFDSPDYWVRGIVDFMVVDEDTAFIIDYKTGSKKYPDTKQLELMAIMTFAHFSQVQQVHAGLLFIAHNSFMPELYKRQNITKLWGSFAPDIVRLTHSVNTNFWPTNPTPLCGWCPVTTCEFQRSRRG
jgi:hypothetical protein